MRDKLPPGEVEAIVENSKDPEVTYTNGWLSLYAEYLAQKLLDK